MMDIVKAGVKVEMKVEMKGGLMGSKKVVYWVVMMVDM